MTSVPRQLSPSRAWCLTLNNYTESELEFLSSSFLADGNKNFIIGKEVGESGTPHLQGYVFTLDRKKFRPLPKYAVNRLNNQGELKQAIHWERAKGNQEQNYIYCSKEGDYITDMVAPPPPPQSLEELVAIWNEPIDYTGTDTQISEAQERRENAALRIIYIETGVLPGP